MLRRLAVLGVVVLTGCPPASPTPPPVRPVSAPIDAAPPTSTEHGRAPLQVAVATEEPAAWVPSDDPNLDPTTNEPWDPVPPVSTEPVQAGPQPDPDAPIEREPVKDGAISRFPGIKIFTEERRLEVDGAVCLKRGPALELMGCTRRGKTHESLLLFDCEPEQLYLALVILGLEPTPQIDQFGQPVALTRGERVVVEVSWAATDAPDDPSAPPAIGGRITRRVEDLCFDQVKQGPMPRVGWVFTGSRHVEVPAPPDWKTMRRVYAASYSGNVAATYHDPDAILDTPLIEGGDDTTYIPWSERLPERGTACVLTIRPWREGDGPPLPAPASAGGGPADVAPPDSRTPADVAPPDSRTPGAPRSP